jgi:hypothetical protein
MILIQPDEHKKYKTNSGDAALNELLWVNH